MTVSTLSGVQITKKPPAKASGKTGTPNGSANGLPDSPPDGTPEKVPEDGAPPSNGAVTANGEGANGGKPLPGVRTLLEFVAWVVFTHQVGSGRPPAGAGVSTNQSHCRLAKEQE